MPEARTPITPKRHHFVPRFLLERFTTTDGRLFFYDFRRPERGVCCTTPQNLFAETHLYSRIEEDGRRDPQFETWLSKVESGFAPIMDAMLESLRAGEPVNLSEADRRAWYEFFHLQWRRVPEVHRRFVGIGEAEQVISDLIDELRERRPDRAAELDRLQTPSNLRRIGQNAKIDALAYPSERVIAVLEARRLAVARVGSLHKSFIIGSTPVVKLTIDGCSDLRDVRSEMWLPIAFDVMLGVGPGRDVTLTMPPEAVRGINMAIASQSSVIAGRSKALVSSLARPR